MKIATLLKGGCFPVSYVYPRELRATRDLLRRRMYLVRHHAELASHIQQTNIQHNLPAFEKRIDRASNRALISNHFQDPNVQRSVDLDIAVLDFLDKQLAALETHILKTAKQYDATALHLLRSIYGVGKTLALVILYEVGDIERFPRHQQFLSYARLVRPRHESAGKTVGSGGAKIGNPYLKWAFSEAASLFLRHNDRAKQYRDALMVKHGKMKSMAIIARRLGTAAFYILKRRKPFEMDAFFASC